MNYDIGIIGGGVIGLSCAWRLAQGGARVALFERGTIGREASHAAAGMLAAQCEMAHHPPPVDGCDDDASTRAAAMFDLCLQSRALYPDFAAELRDQTGHDIELDLRGTRSGLRPLGITYVAKSADDIAIAAFEAQQQRGLNVAEIGDSIRQWLPEIGDFQRAFYLADEGAVDNRKLVAALHEAATRAGVALHENTEVRGVQSDDFGARIRTAQETVSCGKVLLCAGAWSGQLPTPLAPLLRGVQPIGGQMLCLKHDLGTVLYAPTSIWCRAATDDYWSERRSKRPVFAAPIALTQRSRERENCCAPPANFYRNCRMRHC